MAKKKTTEDNEKLSKKDILKKEEQSDTFTDPFAMNDEDEDDDEDWDDDDWDDEEEDEEENEVIQKMFTKMAEFSAKSPEEIKKIFLKFAKSNTGPKNEEEEYEYVAATTILSSSISDMDLIEKYANEFKKDLFINHIVAEEITPNSLLYGIKKGDKETVFFCNVAAQTSDKKIKKNIIQEIRKRVGDIPFCDYLEMMDLLKTKESDGAIIEKYLKKRPDYPLFIVYHIAFQFKKEISIFEKKKLQSELLAILSQRKNLTYLEYSSIIPIYISSIVKMHPEDLSLEIIKALQITYSSICETHSLDEELESYLSELETTFLLDLIKKKRI